MYPWESKPLSLLQITYKRLLDEKEIIVFKSGVILKNAYDKFNDYSFVNSDTFLRRHSRQVQESESAGREFVWAAYAKGWQAEGDFEEKMLFHKSSSTSPPFANSWFQVFGPTKKERKKRWKEEI